ncbi:hypothetical protein TNCV_4522991 [Trichonephila clavipes]|nr:hypothetical protein TNCV_4522991 [Trichonephila clavipes]
MAYRDNSTISSRITFLFPPRATVLVSLKSVQSPSQSPSCESEGSRFRGVEREGEQVFFGHSFSLTCDKKAALTTVFTSCQLIYSQFGLAIHQNDHQARRRFVEWAQNEIAVVSDFHKRILFSDEAHFWLNGYVNKQNCRIWSEANPQVYVETPLHPEKLTVWCALWAGGILLQKR